MHIFYTYFSYHLPKNPYFTSKIKITFFFVNDWSAFLEILFQDWRRSHESLCNSFPIPYEFYFPTLCILLIYLSFCKSTATNTLQTLLIYLPYRLFLLFLPWLPCPFSSCCHRTTTTTTTTSFQHFWSILIFNEEFTLRFGRKKKEKHREFLSFVFLKCRKILLFSNT